MDIEEVFCVLFTVSKKLVLEYLSTFSKVLIT